MTDLDRLAAQPEDSPERRAARRDPNLNGELHVRLLGEGDPDAWASPLTLFVLITLGQDVVLPGARACAEALAMQPRPDLPEVGSTLQPWLRLWWEDELDAGEMLRHLVQLGTAAGQGSREHRRAVLSAVMCARTVAHLVHGKERAAVVVAGLDDIERWAGGDDAVDLDAVRKKLWSIHNRLNPADADVVYAAYDAAYSANAINVAYAANVVAYAANAAAVAGDRTQREHLILMADLIRKHMPLYAVS